MWHVNRRRNCMRCNFGKLWETLGNEARKNGRGQRCWMRWVMGREAAAPGAVTERTSVPSASQVGKAHRSRDRCAVSARRPGHRRRDMQAAARVRLHCSSTGSALLSGSRRHNSSRRRHGQLDFLDVAPLGLHHCAPHPGHAGKH